MPNNSQEYHAHLSWTSAVLDVDMTVSIMSFLVITQTSLFKYIETFTLKNWKFSNKNSDSFHISAQNIDCGYSLEPPRRGGSNEYPQSMF